MVARRFKRETSRSPWMGWRNLKLHTHKFHFLRSLRVLFFAFVVLAVPAKSLAQIGVSVSIAPPELPVYEQPACPEDGDIWVPGYWAWDADIDDYYWVPGTWVEAPEEGFLWTPGYWGWGGSGFVFYDGYWGPTVGFYGGINYGYGYFGQGYEGGRWDNGHFFYNRAVNNVNVTVVHNVYNTTVDTRGVTRVSYNGGNGGINERPTAQEEAAAHDRHAPPVAAQNEQMQAARGNTQLRASVNHGKPPVAATAKAGEFSGGGVVAAREGSYTRPSTPPSGSPTRATNNNANDRTESQPGRVVNTNAPTAVHPKDLPPAEKPAAPNTGNPKLDQKYQQQQEKLSTKQDQERQTLQRQQDQDHQKLAQQNANDARNQQLEQVHQQQTQQLVQRHTAQQQQLQQRQQPAHQSQPKPAEEKH